MRLRRSACPLGGAVCRAHVQYFAFAPSASEMAVGLWPFCILLFIIAPTAIQFLVPLAVSFMLEIGLGCTSRSVC